MACLSRALAAEQELALALVLGRVALGVEQGQARAALPQDCRKAEEVVHGKVHRTQPGQGSRLVDSKDDQAARARTLLALARRRMGRDCLQGIQQAPQQLRHSQCWAGGLSEARSPVLEHGEHGAAGGDGI